MDNLNHDEAEARQGDVEVYDNIMQHDVYHQLGRPVEPIDDNSHENGVNDANGTQSAADTGHDQFQIPEVDEPVVHDAQAEPPTTDASHTGEFVHDIDLFIDTELANNEALQTFYTEGKSILDEFDFPAEFPSDID